MSHAKWYGVNLGNWFLIEPWMSPSLLEGIPAKDEYTLAEVQGKNARAFFDRHRETYITESDFQFLQEWGINAVRIPIGYWILEPDGPYVGGLEHLDRALAWCGQYGIDAIVDLHGAPGAQSTQIHTGRGDFFQWDKDPDYRKRSLGIIEALARRYAHHPGLGGISLLNEPQLSVPAAMLLEYYQAGYEIVRKYNSPERVAVIAEAHPSVRLPEFHGRLKGANIITETHYYQMWEEFTRRTVAENILFPLNRLLPRFLDFNRAGDQIIGEWSLGLGENEELKTLSPAQKGVAYQAFAAAQIYAYSQTRGWFFWSYKVEDRPGWSFRDCVRQGYLPARLQG